ncbi:MAG TPA: hypothetical protein VMY77_15660 [Chitinophagaceae bacterium]|nr:hypothetical protein [Chitinophagaceae bacterium]
MKQKLMAGLIVLSFLVISNITFAQEDSGGYAGGGGGTPPEGSGTTVTPQPTPFHFTRNNGDGTCGGQAQIRMYYTTAPTTAPVLTQIYYNGGPLFTNFSPVTGDLSTYATTGYVSFCLQQSNIPPAIKLTLTYNASSIQQNLSITGTD